MLGDITTADAIYIVCGETDMNKSIDELCVVTKDQLDQDASEIHLCIFSAVNATIE